MTEELHFPACMAENLQPYLPASAALRNNRCCAAQKTSNDGRKPWTTLTFATSLDSSLSLSPGTRTLLSGPGSKAMTHYLRSRHDSILIGVGTAVADDPKLNCRYVSSSHPEAYDGYRHPRPLILDPHLRWPISPESKVLKLASAGQGLAPWIITSVSAAEGLPRDRKELLESLGVKFIPLAPSACGDRFFLWPAILQAISSHGIKSVMVEGGGGVINSLLATDENRRLVDSVIVTVAPMWLGEGGVVVSPPREEADVAAARLQSVLWLPMGEDVVLCGHLTRCDRAGW